MKRTTLIIGALVVALITSNAWWLYNQVDMGITATYRDQVMDEQREALDQLLAILPVVVNSGGKRDPVLATARQVSGDEAEFEKDDYVWVGRLGYRFDAGDTLVAVTTNP